MWTQLVFSIFVRLALVYTIAFMFTSAGMWTQLVFSIFVGLALVYTIAFMFTSAGIWAPLASIMFVQLLPIGEHCIHLHHAGATMLVAYVC